MGRYREYVTVYEEDVKEFLTWYETYLANALAGRWLDDLSFKQAKEIKDRVKKDALASLAEYARMSIGAAFSANALSLKGEWADDNKVRDGRSIARRMGIITDKYKLEPRKSKKEKKRRKKEKQFHEPKELSFDDCINRLRELTEVEENSSGDIIVTKPLDREKINKVWVDVKNILTVRELEEFKRIHTIETKPCGRCKQVKPVYEFYAQESSVDGLQSWCKQCHKEYSRDYRRNK